jgi:hypothetical protein
MHASVLESIWARTVLRRPEEPSFYDTESLGERILVCKARYEAVLHTAHSLSGPHDEEAKEIGERVAVCKIGRSACQQRKRLAWRLLNR